MKTHIKPLYTIGYEGWEIEDFVSCLQGFKINCLLDVREIPLSRKKGFSKKVLSKKLNERGIRYIHMKELGSPREIRHKLYQDGDYDYFFNAFQNYINRKKHFIKYAYEQMKDYVACLMCFEKLAFKCHRSVVAEEIKTHNGIPFEIKNI